ncbi:MAG: CDP-glycerol glycerophosphotransferase family protein [Methanobrevibacter sp.]|nr:CDP-glycerol glycerophosphotransferase family protein [Methanobrevibacter sp.]
MSEKTQNYSISNKTIKEVCDTLFSLEKKYDLNQMKIQGVYAWQLVRIYVYYEISRKIRVFGAPQQAKITLIDKILSFLPFLKNSLFSNPLKGDYHKNILIFDHPRKVKHKGEFKDIYSYFLMDDLDTSSYEVIETPYLNKHFTKKEEYIKYNDSFLLGSYFYKKRTKIHWEANEKDKIDIIQREISSSFNIEIDLLNIMKNHILDFKYQYKKYDQLFKKRTPKYVFVVVAYENQAMIAAAHDNNIEVIELQHGTISNYHLGYNFPNKKDKNNIKYFPSKILVFGSYWREVANYPIEMENIVPCGFPFSDENIRSYLNIEKKSNQILFISQGVIGKYLSEFAYDVAKKLENMKEKYKIIYKLHPGEYSTWQKNYSYLKKCEKLANFHIIDNSEVSLYDLFSKSEYQVGVFSTAIYEGLLFNDKTFILDSPGSEYMDSLVEKNYVKKIVTAQEFIDSIANFKVNSYDKDFFFKKYDKSFLKRIILK